MNSTGAADLIRRIRLGAAISQRELARRAGTSQPAIARYESGRTAPSAATLERLATACGWRLRIDAEPVPDPEHRQLAKMLLEMTPSERLRALGRFARLRGMVAAG